MPSESLTETVRRRLRELSEARRFRQHELAKRLQTTQSNVSKVLRNDDRPLTLDVLEAVAELTQTPIAELVAPPGSMVRQLDPTEAQVLRALRLWPRSVTRALYEFVAFFADEAPGAIQTRNLHEFWRNLRTQSDRDALHGIAAMLSEGMLPSDLREQLVHRVTAERFAATKSRGGRPPKGRTPNDEPT